MGRKPDYVDNALAERDAEIAALRAELAGVIEGHTAAVKLWQQQDYNNSTEIAALKRRVNEADQIVRAGEAERKALAGVVLELQAQIAYHDRRMSIAVGALENIENVGAEVAPYNEHAAQVQMFDTAQDALKRITELDYEQMGVD